MRSSSRSKMGFTAILGSSSPNRPSLQPRHSSGLPAGRAGRVQMALYPNYSCDTPPAAGASNPRPRRRHPLEKRPFGRTGLQVSAIGFGCWEIGGGYGQIDETQFARAVERALDLGINCFDTAEGYGLGASERALGRALGRRRRDAIIVTKFGIGYRDKPNLRDASRARCMACIEKSLDNLGTDCVDVFLIHWPDHVTPFEETMRALDDVVRQGKARFVGVSNFKREEIDACMRVRRVDVAQYGWNMFDRRMQRDVFPYCGDNGIGVMAYGSLAYGLLTGAFSGETKFGADDW